MEEIWKYIPGYEGLYKISNYGRVKSFYFGRKNILKAQDQNGYKFYILSKNKTIKNLFAHRLVMMSFVGISKLEVNHIDGNPGNNNIANLEYCTRSGNMIHRRDVLGYIAPKGKYHKSSKKVNQYTLDGKLIKTWDCIMDVTRELGFNNRHIGECCRGEINTSRGYIWRYASQTKNLLTTP